jgi:hypothetical protein
MTASFLIDVEHSVEIETKSAQTPRPGRSQCGGTIALNFAPQVTEYPKVNLKVIVAKTKWFRSTSAQKIRYGFLRGIACLF